METTFTLRDPPYSYVRLQLRQGLMPYQQSVDDITIRAHVTSALSQYLGITGTAIPIDILKLQGEQTWIRLPRDDESAVVAALSQWVGKGDISLRIMARSTWLAGLVNEIGDSKLWSLEV